MRARYPDTEGFIERDGIKVAYEVFGSGEPALVFTPTDPLVHSRAWKAQVPCPASTRPSSPTVTPSAPSSVTGPVRRSAWSPSAGPG